MIKERHLLRIIKGPYLLQYPGEKVFGTCSPVRYTHSSSRGKWTSQPYIKILYPAHLQTKLDRPYTPCHFPREISSSLRTLTLQHAIARHGSAHFHTNAHWSISTHGLAFSFRIQIFVRATAVLLESVCIFMHLPVMARLMKKKQLLRYCSRAGCSTSDNGYPMGASENMF